MTLPSGDSVTFLHALARRIGTRVVVLVPRDRPPRELWFGDVGDADEVARLAEVGRGLLGAEAGSARVEVPDGVAGIVSRSPSGELGCAVVAAKDAGQEWSRAEHALFEFAVDFHRSSVVRCASRPLPSSRVTFGRHRGAADAELASGMRAAAERGELFLLYQPEVDLVTGDVIAVEALTRWLHPLYGELGPDSFIALAEQSDLIQVLGAWVVEESFRDLATWLHAVPELALVLRVNVSPRQLARPGFAAIFAAALRRHGVPGDRVCVELTETTVVSDVAVVSSVLDELRAVGVRSALDDLGSGYSSLNRLRRLPVDLLKLDRGLVAGIDADPRAQTIVRGVVRLATELGMAVIAEGVETADELEVLVRLGCRSAQGHYFGRPMPAARLVDYLREAGREAGSDAPAKR